MNHLKVERILFFSVTLEIMCVVCVVCVVLYVCCVVLCVLCVVVCGCVLVCWCVGVGVFVVRLISCVVVINLSRFEQR